MCQLIASMASYLPRLSVTRAGSRRQLQADRRRSRDSAARSRLAHAAVRSRMTADHAVRERSTSRASTPRNIAAAIGMQYFRQVVITWSIRSRGSVQRTHIMNVTPTTP